MNSNKSCLPSLWCKVSLALGQLYARTPRLTVGLERGLPNTCCPDRGPWDTQDFTRHCVEVRRMAGLELTGFWTEISVLELVDSGAGAREEPSQ